MHANACCRISRLAAALVALVMLLCLQANGQQKTVEMKLTSSSPVKVFGQTYFKDQTVLVGGLPYDYYIASWDFSMDIRGWDHFTGLVGFAYDGNRTQSVKFYVDKELVADIKVHAGQRAVPFDIPLTGHSTVAVAGVDCNSGPHILTPVLIKGSPTAYLDPVSLGYLVDELVEKVDADPGLKAKLTNATVAVTTFNLLNIPYPNVAIATAEDIATACINHKIPLVERGKVDQQLKAAGVTDCNMISPDIAKLIAKRTGCNYLIVGNIFDPGGLESQKVIVSARLIDTSTGKAVVAHKMDIAKISPTKAKTE